MGRTKRRRGVDYEAILTREGLAPLDVDGVMVSTHPGDAHPADRSSATAEYLDWAADVLATYPFRSPRERRVWQLFAQGKSRSQIAARLRLTVYVVRKAIKRVSQRCNPPPVPNPWHRGGSEAKQDDPPEDQPEETLSEVVARDPEAAADMLTAATRYIDDLGDDYMQEFRELIDVDVEADGYDYCSEWNRHTEREAVRLPHDGAHSEDLCGPVRTFSKSEIERMNLTPPRQIKRGNGG